MESFFQISNLFSNYWPKKENYSNELRDLNIDQSAMCYTSKSSINVKRVISLLRITAKKAEDF